MLGKVQMFVELTLFVACPQAIGDHSAKWIVAFLCWRRIRARGLLRLTEVQSAKQYK